MTLRSLDPGRALHGVRENLGLKIGLLAGSAILIVVLLLVGLFGSMKIPIISKLSFLQILLLMGILFAAFSMLVIS
ncbi:MAG: hypothetical protein R3257_04820, partial [bacterium]|nr:hypothetical protein [bacterium]